MYMPRFPCKIQTIMNSKTCDSGGSGWGLEDPCVYFPSSSFIIPRREGESRNSIYPVPGIDEIVLVLEFQNNFITYKSSY